MSALVTSLIFAIGVAAFVWSKLSQMTGNASPKNSLLGAGVVGVIAFLVLLSILKGLLGL